MLRRSGRRCRAGCSLLLNIMLIIGVTTEVLEVGSFGCMTLVGMGFRDSGVVEWSAGYPAFCMRDCVMWLVDVYSTQDLLM